MIATSLVSDEDAAYAYFNDHQFSDVPRLFLDTRIGLGEFPQERALLDLTPLGSSPPTGSNHSSPTDYFETGSYSV
ncbi:MAG: hypothetical protein GY896_03670 [Gammaproteobacteria bacterium]|nr:hypothetical protein [Gammaproteobacteria bacterium]